MLLGRQWSARRGGRSLVGLRRVQPHDNSGDSGGKRELALSARRPPHSQTVHADGWGCWWMIPRSWSIVGHGTRRWIILWQFAHYADLAFMPSWAVARVGAAA